METESVRKPKKVGPYAPPENIGRVLGKVRQSGVRKLDAEFLSQLGIHIAMAPRTIRTLEFLDFTDKDGNPKAALQEYYAAGTDQEAQAILANAVRSSYEIIFRAADPTTEGRDKIEQAFRLMEPAGQRNRMVTLFLGLCRLAGMVVKDPPSSRPGASRPKANKQANGRSTQGVANVTPPQNTTQGQPTASHHARQVGTILEKLLDKFPAFDPSWSDELKTAWFDGFKRLQEEVKR